MMESADLFSHIDHLVVGAYDLNSGQNYLHEIFGASSVAGGTHPSMGTHNCLMKIGPSSYLEIISINREMDQPKRPHWFGLDKFSRDTEPKLLTWVVRTNNIHAITAGSKISFGKIEKMKRGKLEWFITIRSDGNMPLHGISPTLIQWQADQHPADTLPESGCLLNRLELFHPQANLIDKMLTSIGLQDQFTIVTCKEDIRPSMIAYFETPNGPRKMIW